MTTTTRNEAAERLLLASVSPDDDGESIVTRMNLMDEALAAERRATVERIRAAMQVRGLTEDASNDINAMLTILDGELAR